MEQCKSAGLVVDQFQWRKHPNNDATKGDTICLSHLGVLEFQ
jgi:hypothetical protein